MKAATDKISRLRTEALNLAAARLDTSSSLEIARLINAEDARVAPAVRRALPQIARAIDLIAAALQRGGRLIYVGAGTSGRIAALGAAVEANEDSRALGRRDMGAKKPGKNDVVVGIAASGRTPYTLAAVEFARRQGTKTVAVTCNRSSALGKVADVSIVVEVGPEVVAGSSRMKAGTAQKMVLNMLSTGAMARLGYVYGNLMINVHLKNRKLTARGISILENAAAVDRPQARRALRLAGNRVPIALVMLQAGVSRREAEKCLRLAKGHVRKAIQAALGYRTNGNRTR